MDLVDPFSSAGFITMEKWHMLIQYLLHYSRQQCVGLAEASGGYAR